MKKRSKVENESTIVLVAPGPSLTSEDAALVVASGLPVMAIGDAYRVLPTATWLYACDARWWAHHNDRIAEAGYYGERYSIDPEAHQYGCALVPCIDYHAPTAGLSRVPGMISAGNSSGYQALGFAHVLGYQRIVLLGFDYGATGQGHFCGSPPSGLDTPSDFVAMCQFMDVLAADLSVVGKQVINCTRTSALACFARAPLVDIIPRAASIAVTE